MLLQICGSTIVAEDGSSAEVDVIIWATGFDLPAILKTIDVRGPNSSSLSDTLTKRPEGFYGLAYSGFPNLFTIMGPNTGLGHNSIIYIIECAVNSIVQLAKWVDTKKLKCIEVSKTAQDCFNADVQQRLKGSVWFSGCKSWYLDRLGAEEGSDSGSSVLWPGLCIEYYKRTAWLKKDDWEATAAEPRAAAALDKVKQQ